MVINWSKAAGELIIIVAGVMLALAADRWRESYSESHLAHSYLSRLQLDLNNDIAGFDITLDWSQAVDESAQYILAVYRGKDVPRIEFEEFVYHIFRASWAPQGFSTSATFDDLISTGNFSLIPTELRQSINHYYLRKQNLIERRSRFFEQEAVMGYWQVPAQVLGPELTPVVWQAFQGKGDKFMPQAGSLSLTTAQIEKLTNQLRAVPRLETQLAQVRHYMAQRSIIFGERLPEAAGQLKRQLAEFLQQ